MSVTAKVLSACTLATAVAVLALSCSKEENITNPASPEETPEAPPVGFQPTSPTLSSPGNCLADVVSFSPVCEASDVKISEITRISGPIECDKGEDITVDLQAELVATAAERFDIGIFIALDGGDARTGECFRSFLDGDTDDNGTADFLSPNNPPTCSPDNHDPDNGPWFNAECQEDADDTCGDLKQAEDNLFDFGVQTFTCADADTNGFLDIGTCVSWDNNEMGTCNGLDDAKPGTPAKCRCEPINVPITVNESAKIEVVKECDPTSDDGTFDLKIDDNVEADNAACGGSTDEVIVSAGTQVDPGDDHTIAEDDFSNGASSYDSSFECVDDGGTTVIDQCGATGDQTCSGTGTGPFDLHVEPDDDIVCTFTNVRHGKIVVEKQTLPDGETQEFAFDGPDTFDPSLSDGETDSLEVSPGQYDVTETVPAGWDLDDITCDDGNSSGDEGTGTATYNVEAGERVKCTFTNAEHGTIIIKKETDPDGATGTFGFTDDIESPNSFSLDDGDMKTFSDVSHGSYEVSEDDPNPNFDLTDVDCEDSDTGGTASSGDVGNLKASIELDPGETVTCTFTNTQRAMVTANKTQSGSPAAGFQFEIRVGADETTSEGTVVAQGTSDATGVVDFACASGADPDVCQNDSNGIAKLVPGDYQFCEVAMMPGWANNIPSPPGFTPLGETPEGGDNSTECVDITLSAGDTGVPSVLPDPIDNTPPPGGEARTIGFWKNWSSCDGRGNQDPVLDNTLLEAGGILIGDRLVDTCLEAFYILDKRDQTGKHTKRAGDACYDLAAQLLAARLNVEADAESCSELTTVMTSAQTLLDTKNFTGSGACLPPPKKGGDSADRTNALNLAAQLDAYNNNDPGSLCH